MYLLMRQQKTSTLEPTSAISFDASVRVGERSDVSCELHESACASYLAPCSIRKLTELCHSACLLAGPLLWSSAVCNSL
jgi:hypothetical protein